MTTGRDKFVAAGLAVLVAVTVSGVTRAATDTTTKKSCCSPEAAEAAGESSAAAVRMDGVVIPDVTLVRMDGSRVSLRDEIDCGKPVLLNFIFTTCTTICPVMSATFAQLQDRLGPERDNVRMISVSIDPERDTPARLREYAGRHQAGPEWHFLTGRPEDIEKVQRAFDAFTGSKFSHQPLTFLRAANGGAWERVTGLRGAESLEAEYRNVQVAAR